MSPVLASALPLWHGAALLVPAIAALSAAVVSMRASSPDAAWRSARRASSVTVAASAAAAVLRAMTEDRGGMLLRTDTVGVAMSLLIGFVGWVVIRYSQSYLAGDRRERMYVGRLLMTIAAVSTVVVANNLILLLLAWSATSLALHGLLTFYGDRPVAVAVAHKKFILARFADLSMVGAVVAFVVAFGTLRIDRIAAGAVAATSMPIAARIGIALIALAAVLKCAQLPFHGWLIQVMEAPTPVSALLHAGVVNLGGFVLLRFAPVVDRAVETRALLVGVGTVTAVVAALVMTTRISVKVALAWSTCAQMGFMLMQCGLGLWEMALLHLLAHSLYKAHAFLGAGGVVRQTQRKQLLTAPGAPGALSFALAAGVSALGVVSVGWLWGRLPFVGPPSATIWVMGGIVALAMVPLMTQTNGGARRAARPTMLIQTLAVPVAYFVLHELFSRLVAHGQAAPIALLVVVGTAFVGLFIVQAACSAFPARGLVRRLYPWIYGGLFIDEAFTRLAFAAWPPPATRHVDSPLPPPSVVLAQSVKRPLGVR